MNKGIRDFIHNIFRIFFIYLLFTICAYSSNISTLNLTNEEQIWLKKHRIISVQNDPDWPPFNFNENDTPQGFSIDYMNLLAEKIGFQVKYITDKAWSDYLDMIRNTNLDVIVNIVKTEERQSYILFTKPFIKNPNVIVSIKERPYQSIKQLSGKTVAIPKSYFYQKVLSKLFPNIKQLLLKSTLECLKAVTFGKADATVGELAVVQYLVDKNLLTNLRVSGEVQMGNSDLANLRIGIRKDWPILQSILSKAMDNVSPEEMGKISKKWLTATDQNKAVQLTPEEKSG